MKTRFTKVIYCTFVSMLSAVIFVSCTQKEEVAPTPTPLIGAWRITNITINPPVAGEATNTIKVLSDCMINYTLQFNADNTLLAESQVNTCFSNLGSLGLGSSLDRWILKNNTLTIVPQSGEIDVYEIEISDQTMRWKLRSTDTSSSTTIVISFSKIQ